MSQALDDFLAGCADGQVPGIAAIGTDVSDNLYESAAGVANTATGRAVTTTTPHAIYSMTKPVTSLAVMMLVEQGQMDLQAPINDYLPEFRDPDVITGLDAEAKAFTPAPLEKRITVHHLLTNTSGHGYAFCNATLGALLPDSSAPDFPICHQPGEAWTYGPATGLLGKAIAAVAGESLEAALNRLVFAPLGMRETSFEPRDNQAHIHRHQDGEWQPQDIAGRMEAGDAGLISTAQDYARFVRCLLNDGAPLIQPVTFKQMISNQIGDLFVTEQPSILPHFALPFPTGGGVDKFSYGFQLHMAPEAGMRSPGSFSWCGVANTYFWGDPVRKVGGVVLMQVSPLYTPACLDAVAGFEKHFYEIID